jgi:GNAT superfamily N-acetyltransferase
MIAFRESFNAIDFFQLAQQVWPGDYTVSDVADALKPTTNIGAWDNERLVGTVRVLTDGHFFATIPEILVLPEYQRQGIGRELMHRAVAVAPRKRLFFGAQPQRVRDDITYRHCGDTSDDLPPEPPTRAPVLKRFQKITKDTWGCEAFEQLGRESRRFT